MIKCSECLIDKSEDSFKNNKVKLKSGDIYRRYKFCKDCAKIRYKDSKKKSDKKYYLKNKEKHYKRNRDIITNDPETYKEYMRNYYLKNKDKMKEKNKQYREMESSKKNRMIKHKERLDNDNLYRLTINIRSTIKNSMKRKNIQKNDKTTKILGCSFEDFLIYIESKFENWMDWDNYGLYNGELNYGWDIDHIIPTSLATTEEELIKLNHYTNLQPLCSYTNRYIKRDKII